MTRTPRQVPRDRLTSRIVALVCASTFLLGMATGSPAADSPATTGPATETRFPPLKLPAGFRATLFACDPFIEYPSAIARGPRAGTLFTAVDYMTGLGFEIVRRDEVRLLVDSDGDGYADRQTKHADGFNSIQGMTFDGDTLYVMHAPFLTALRDTDGDGTADDRRDLLSGLGLPPEENPQRLHCANGVTAGHDGWLYLALGDHGCRVPRPEGDLLVLEGGGILRCRPDGKDLHVFSRGLRNIYDVALDAEQNVFVRDNENDGGTYKQRMIFSLHGADHGYPYYYEERPDEPMPPLSDLGLGSSAGGVCYLETQFPAEFRGNLFWCEWGRAVMRYPLRRTGAGFASEREIEFAAGADDDPYPFKPTDLVVDRDGSLFVSDWCDGQRPVRGRGRIYRITYDPTPTSAPSAEPGEAPDDLESLVKRLDASSYFERCEARRAIEKRGAPGTAALIEALDRGTLGATGRGHAVWSVARQGRAEADKMLLSIAAADPDASVRAQAVRAWADRHDPVVVGRRLDAASGDADAAAVLARSIDTADPRLRLEVVVALGRLQWSGLVEWLEHHVRDVDGVTGHAAAVALSRSKNLPAILARLDRPSSDPVRKLVVRSLVDRFDPAIVDDLIRRMATETDGARLAEYADLLARVYKRPAPWVYWGYRPLPRPAGTLDWERTDSIAAALDRLLKTTAESGLRTAVLRRMIREKVRTPVDTLSALAADERRSEAVAAILDALAAHPSGAVRQAAAAIVADTRHASENRLRALAMLAAELDEPAASRLGQVAAKLEDGPVLAELLRTAAGDKRVPIDGVVERTLASADPEIVAATIGVLAARRTADAAAAIERHWGAADPRIRRAVVMAAGELLPAGAADRLPAAAGDADPAVRRAAFVALHRAKDPRALTPAVSALADHETALEALACIGAVGGPDQAAAIVNLAHRRPTPDFVTPVVHILQAWSTDPKVDEAVRDKLQGSIAEIQATAGMIVRWNVRDPKLEAATDAVVTQAASAGPADPAWSNVFATGPEGRFKFDSSTEQPAAWWAYTDLTVAAAAEIECRTSSDGPLEIRLNGRSIFRRDRAATFRVDAEQFTASLRPGPNRLLMRIEPPPGKAPEFHLRFRRKSSKAEHERLIQAALTRTGNVERGRELFFAGEKSLCIKCHRLDDRGEKIGPELTGVGGRFSRIYIVESILEPSRTIAPSFDTISVALVDGRTLTGVRTAETETTLTLADNEGKQHPIPKVDIEEREVRPTSTMAEGLEKRLTVEQFVDLVAFLMSRREPYKAKP